VPGDALGEAALVRARAGDEDPFRTLVGDHAAVEVADDLVRDDDPALVVLGGCLRLDARVDGLD
jgi:hypothetical protein